MEEHAAGEVSAVREGGVTGSRYQFDADPGDRRCRLRRLEEMEDPATIEYLERIGVASGWRCLEVGAGGGSIAAWLCRRVGPAGRVVATDIDTRLLGELRLPRLEILEHDVTRDDMERAAFDLVHTRNVLVHIPERERVLRRMAAAVRPGGWILVEEPDVSTDGPDPAAAPDKQDLYRTCVQAIYAYLVDEGLDLCLGVRLYGMLRALGFRSLRAEGRVWMYRGGNGSPHMPAFAELQDALVATGRVTERQFRQFIDLAGDPGFAWRESLTMSAWGQRPEA